MIQSALSLHLVFAAILLFPRHASAQLHLNISRTTDRTVRVGGEAAQPNVLEASTNLREWVAVQTNAAPGPFEYLESPSPGQRAYRLHALIPGAEPDWLFMAGEGFNTVQFAPSGKLAYIAWRNEDLLYRERGLDATWSETVVARTGSRYQPGSREEYRFEPHAALLFDMASQPHVVVLAGEDGVRYRLNPDQSWSQKTIPLSGANAGVALFGAEMGPNGALHLAFVNLESPARLIYGTDRTGAWEWVPVSTITGSPRGFLRQSYAPRFFSLAVDSRNAGHITFTPEFSMPVYSGYRRPYSELAYASNVSGWWLTETVLRPDDSSGDAGTGASVAIGPDDKPAIASWFNQRADTGSAQASRLLYHQKDAAGNWRQTLVTSTPQGYSAGDGPKGTGFAPYLRFDGTGRPHILFCDHAAEHFPVWGQDEYGGQIRHAVFKDAEWAIDTLFEQTTPLDQQMIYPAFALGAEEIAVTGLDRATQFGPDARPRTVTSTYRFLFLTAPLR